jgi:hypothetical protein
VRRRFQTSNDERSTRTLRPSRSRVHALATRYACDLEQRSSSAISFTVM